MFTHVRDVLVNDGQLTDVPQMREVLTNVLAQIRHQVHLGLKYLQYNEKINYQDLVVTDRKKDKKK